MKHIVERAIVPHNPSASSIINKEQYNLYAPVAGQGKVGMAAFDLRDFEVKNQTVFLHADVREGIDKALSLEADIIENTANIAINAGNITKNAGDIAINAGNITKNAGDITKNADAIKDITKAISDLEDFDTTHEAEFKAFVDAVNDLLDMDDETLDQYHEVLALIKSNRDNLSYLGTQKVDKDKIVDNLNTALANHVLSANQGVVLKRLITALENTLNTEVANRESAVTSEENARKAADATHTADIAALKTRLDSLNLPVIQKSLYEHNLYIRTSDGTYPNLTLHYTILNNSESEMGTLEAFDYLRDNYRYGSNTTVVKDFNGFIKRDVNGVVQSNPVIQTLIMDANLLHVYSINSDGSVAIEQIDYSTVTVIDVVVPIANVAEGGGGNGLAIIECLELPTQNISTSHFYRTSDGKLYWYDGSAWHRVVEDTGMFEILPAKENTVSSHTASAYNIVPYKKWFHSELIGSASNFTPSVEDLSNLAIHVKYYYGDDVKERIYFLNELEVDATLPVIDGDVVVGEGYRYIVPSIAHREDTDAESVYPRVQVVVLFGEGVGFPVMSDEYGDDVTHTGVVSPAGYLGRAEKDYLDSDGNMQYVCTEVVCIDITAPTLKLKNTHLNLPDNYDFKLILEKIAELSKNPAENIASITSGTPEIVEEEGMSITVTPITVTTSTGATHTFHIPALNGSGSSSSSGGYFEGTAEEYEASADTVPVGAIVWLTDEEGNITTAVLDKAILGQMILGTS